MLYIIALLSGSLISWYFTRRYYRAKIKNNMDAYLFDINVLQARHKKMFHTNFKLRKRLDALRAPLLKVESIKSKITISEN